jgi:hypothetical protein
MVWNEAGEKGKGQEVVLANPRVLSSSGALTLFEEGCLSFPGIYADVKVRWNFFFSFFCHTDLFSSQSHVTYTPTHTHTHTHIYILSPFPALYSGPAKCGCGLMTCLASPSPFLSPDLQPESSNTNMITWTESCITIAWKQILGASSSKN